MSSNRGKKVNWERGTKGEKSHRHQSSRDSGVGSSSASDRASLGTSPLDESSFSYYQIQNQRLSVTALQEALDAANERIRQLQGDNTKLNASLAESNKENRALRKERLELLNRVEVLEEDLENERRANEKYRRGSSPRTGGAAPAPSKTKTERRTTPPRREEPRSSRRDDEKSEKSQGSSYSSRTTYMPAAPQAPPPRHDNPFLPQSPNLTRNPSVSYAPTSVTYAPAPVAYTTTSQYPPPPTSATSAHFPVDGLYHPYPV